MHPPSGRVASLSILKGLVEEKCVLTVQVDGALVVREWLTTSSIGGCQKIRQSVDSH